MKNNQQPTCRNAACVNKWRDSRKKYNQGDIRTLLGKDCEVKKMMMFLREMECRGNMTGG